MRSIAYAQRHQMHRNLTTAAGIHGLVGTGIWARSLLDSAITSISRQLLNYGLGLLLNQAMEGIPYAIRRNVIQEIATGLAWHRADITVRKMAYFEVRRQESGSSSGQTSVCN